MAHRQLIELDVSRDQVKRWVDRGRLHRLYEGVYAVGHRAVGREGRYLAAVLACGDGAVLSHASAAQLHGLRPSGAALVDVIVRRGGERRPRGVRALKRALGTRADTAFTRSELERRFLALCRRAGLPEPAANAKVQTAPGKWLEVDFQWRAAGLVVETDGWSTHGTLAAARRDRRRDRELRAAGWRVERFMWDDVVADGPAVVEALAVAFRPHAQPS